MNNNNSRPSLPNTMDTCDWRTKLPAHSRQRIVNRMYFYLVSAKFSSLALFCLMLPRDNTMLLWSSLPNSSVSLLFYLRRMETLQKNIPSSGPEDINELRRISARFEEKIFSCAVSQTDYLHKISMKMMTMEANSQNAAGSSSSIAAANNGTPTDSIPTNQGHLLPGSLPTNQSQAAQPLMSQTMQSNTASVMTGSTALPSSMPPVSSITNNNVTSAVNQNSNMQNVAGMLQDSSGQHGLSSNMFSGSQRQMRGRPRLMSSQQPQSAQSLYQEQKQNFQSGNVPNPNSLLPSHMQQQRQNQLHSSQQPGIPTSTTQPSTVNSAPLQGLHTNQQSSSQLSAQQTTQSMLRQHQSALLRSHPQSQQASGMHQQQTSLPQQSISPLQQQQTQMMRQQAANSSSIQQKQTMGQHVVGDMQQQHQQRLMSQQNNMMNIQQQQTQQQPLQQTQQQQKQQPPAQQQLMPQQNSLQATHQQPLGTQSNVAGLQQPQQQLLSSQAGNSSLQANQHSVHMLSQPAVGLQRTHQTSHGLFSSQGQQQSQNQPSQQQMMPQLQSHHQQLGLQQQPNLLQQDVQQRLQVSGQVTGSLLPPQNVVDQQRQLYQSQRTLPEMPSSSLDSTAQTENANGGDWQEEVYQKIKSMKEAYLPDLNEIYQRVASKLQQDSLPQQQRSDQFDKLKQFKTMLERMIQFLSVSKSNIMPLLKDKVPNYEKQIISFLNMHRPRRPIQQGQLPQPQMQQPMQQPQSQTVQDQSHDSQTNQQMQSMGMQGSGPRAQQSSLTNMQNNVLSSRSGVSAPQQNIPSSIPGSSLESGQGNAMNNGQQVAMGSMQQNTSQQVNNSSASAQSGLSTLQSNVQTQLSSSLLQHQHLKQQQDQQMTQQLKQQFQQRQMQQQLLQKQQVMQQQQQQQLQARQQAAQLQQMNDMNDLTARQGMNASRAMLQQHSLQGQRPTYPLQQLKPGSQLSVSSPQLLQGASPQMSQQHMSPLIDQKNLPSDNKMGTPLQSANSPFVVPSPATPMAPSPMQVDSEKPSSLSMGNIARQQATGMQGVVQSLAIGTPGISASPLL